MAESLPATAEGLGSIPGSGRTPGRGNGSPLQNSWLENPMGGGGCVKLKIPSLSHTSPFSRVQWPHWLCCWTARMETILMPATLTVLPWSRGQRPVRR